MNALTRFILAASMTCMMVFSCMCCEVGTIDDDPVDTMSDFRMSDIMDNLLEMQPAYAASYLKAIQLAASPTNGDIAVAQTDGSLTWTAQSALAGGSPPGSDTWVPYNDNDSWGAEAGFYYDDAADVLYAGNFGAGAAMIAGSYIEATTYLEAGSAVMAGSYVSAVTYISADSYVSAGSYVSAVNHMQTGDATHPGSLIMHNGGGEAFTQTYPDAAPGLSGAGWHLPVDVPVAGEVVTVESISTNVAVLEYSAATYIDSFVGYFDTKSPPVTDGYISLDTSGTVDFAGTGATDIVGYGVFKNCSIVGITANYELADGTDECTVVIYPREDGANIHANCKLTLAETAGNRESASASFTVGDYTVSADQTFGIYIDVIGDATPDAELTNLQVTVYYHYSL